MRHVPRPIEHDELEWMEPLAKLAGVSLRGAKFVFIEPNLDTNWLVITRDNKVFGFHDIMTLDPDWERSVPKTNPVCDECQRPL